MSHRHVAGRVLALVMFLSLLTPACSATTSSDAGPEDGGAGDAGRVDAGDAGGADAGVALRRPYEPWKLLQAAVRESPDHRQARAARLVAAKDAAGLFSFVRDEVALLPLPQGSVVNPITAMRFGPRATLRGGAGTFRDRAELLAELLARAGFAAEVVYGAPSGALDAAAMRRAFLRTPAPEFRPAAPPDGHASWEALVSGTTTPGPLPGLDPDGAEARALATTLLAALDGGLDAPAVALELPSSIPLVRALLDGGAVLLNPIREDAAVGEGDVALSGVAPPADPLPDVEAVIELVRSDEPSRRVEVLRGRFPLDEVLGRQLLVRFAPPESFETAFGRTNESLRTFVPVLALAGSDLAAEESAAGATLGTAFTTGGDLLPTDSGGQLSINGVPFVEGDPSRAALVRQLQVSVSSTASFPEVELAVAAVDASGQAVAGLPATAFQVEEDGAPRPALFRTNTADAPRVVFLLDVSLSQPAALTDTDARRTLGETLGAAVLAAAPDARVQVAALGGLPALASGYERLDATTIGARFAAAVGTGSSIYTALGHAAESGANLVVLLSDGLADEPVDDIARREPALLRAGPVLSVGCASNPATIQRALLERLAALTGGRYVDAQDLASTSGLTTAIGAVLDGQQLAPYRVNVLAAAGGPGTRTVTVRVGTASATATYVAPATASAGARVTGLRLTLTHRGESVSRWLAGNQATGASEQAANASAVTGLLLGSALVSFEAGAPSLSTVLDDIVSARLGTEPLYAAALAQDGAGILAGYRAAWPAFPWVLAGLHASLVARAGTAVRESQFRAVMLLTSAGGASAQRVDVLPFTRFEALGASTPREAFAGALEASLRLARVEATLHPVNTQALLAGKALRHYPPGGLVEGDLPPVAAGERARFLALLSQWSGHHRLVAADGSSLAFWAVHPSGSALGVLPDGTGGAQSAQCGDVSSLNRYFETLTLLYRLLGIPEVSVYQVLGKFAAVTACKAALCLAGGPVPPWVTDQGAAVQLTCDLAKALAGDLLGYIVPSTGSFGGDVLRAYGNDALGGALIPCPPPPPDSCP